MDFRHYKNLRNKVNNMKKIAIANYYNNIESNLINASNKSSKIYWKLLKDVFKSKVRTEIPPLQVKDNGNVHITYSDFDKVEALNSYFASISSLFDNEPTLPDFSLFCNNVLENIEIVEQDIIDIISVLPINKAIGPDSISHKMLKATIFTISTPLCILFNRSLKEHSFPKQWKVANILPLFKNGDPSELSNYRPVSLLSCVGKIMERVIFKYVYNYFHSNGLFYKYQAGFLPGHSTVYQLIETYDSIVKAIDEGKHCCMVFCDLSKAFDRVWHKGLLFKLKSYGVNGLLLQWFESYLNYRNQRVLFRNTVSGSKFVQAGVPQGSVLGPLLFLIYVNDVADNMSGLCRLYADDNSLQHCSSNTQTIQLQLNNDLEKLNAWSKQWLLKFNPSKTKAVFFSTKKNVDLPSLEFQNCSLDFVSTQKHLGIIISNDFSWSAYIDSLLASANKKLGLLKKLKFKVSAKTLSLLYTTFIRPSLEYASEVWGGCSNQESEKLEKLQLAAARIVTGLTSLASRDSLYFETGWEPLIVRRRVKLKTIMYKIYHNLVPDYLQNILPSIRSHESNYVTRQSQNYSIPKCRLNIYKSSFVPLAIDEWNSVPMEIRQSSSINSFKQRLHVPKKPRPSYFSYGERYWNIIHTRLRHKCALNNDLFRCNIIDSPLCSCGKTEDAYHFFFSCTKYSASRNDLFNAVFKIDNLHIVDTHVLLWGDNSISIDDNVKLFSNVQLFIKRSGRFCV